jgi:Mg2+ and Co2+ transporter CorA
VTVGTGFMAVIAWLFGMNVPIPWDHLGYMFWYILLGSIIFLAWWYILLKKRKRL